MTLCEKNSKTRKGDFNMEGKMKVAVMEGIGKMGYLERDIPVPKDDEVLVKLEYVGICGSDLHYYEHGRIGDYIVEPPFVLGHEPGGTVVEVGKDVKHLKVGDRVALEPGKTCGHCEFCKTGRYNLCPDVIFFATPPVDGVFQEYVAHEADLCFKLPDNVDTMEGALIEPLAVAVHGVKQVGDVKGLNIAVLGAGPIGNLVAQAAKGMGAAKVMITDVSDLRLDKAKECGIDVCVNTMEKDFGEAMVEAFGPDKADVIYDCAGNNITMGQAIKYARKGSIIVLVAVFAGMATVDLAVANDHELDIKSTMMYRHDDYVDGIELVNEGKVHLRPLISKTFAFKDYLKAYQYIDDNRETTMKVIINVNEK